MTGILLAVRIVLSVCRTLVKPWFIDTGQATTSWTPPLGLTTQMAWIAVSLVVACLLGRQVLVGSTLHSPVIRSEALLMTVKPVGEFENVLTLCPYPWRLLVSLMDMFRIPALCRLYLRVSRVMVLNLAA